MIERGMKMGKCTWELQNYLVSQIGKMKKQLGYGDTVNALYGEDYKIQNLKKIYTELTDEYDLINGGI